MKRLAPILIGLVFALLHGWALTVLWMQGPIARRIPLVCVYAGVLVLSAFITKRVPPPLAASLIPFAVVLVWWLRQAGLL